MTKSQVSIILEDVELEDAADLIVTAEVTGDVSPPVRSHDRYQPDDPLEVTISRQGTKQ